MKPHIFSDKEKIIKILEATGVSRSELARRLGVTYKTVYRWLNEGRMPHPVQSREIEQLFKEHIDLRNTVFILAKKVKNPIEILENNEGIRDRFLVEMTYHSNAIEGSRMSKKETEMAIKGKKIKDKELYEIFEVVNHKNAMEFALDNIKPNFKIDENYILKLHSIVMYNFNNKLPGKYRTGPVNLIGADVKLASAQDVPLKMGKLIKSINDYRDDPIVKIAKDHYEFEVTHPFFDGNGRVGRLIIMTQLLSKGFAPAIIRVEDRYKYYFGLGRADFGDYNNITQVVCDGIIKGYELLSGEK